MATVTRDIRIDAAPDVVRRNLVDPERRRAWLGEDVEGEATDDGLRFVRPQGDQASRVHIAVTPDGEGSRVTVTEEVAVDADPHGAPEALLASVTHLPWAAPAVETAPTEDEDLAAPSPSPSRRDDAIWPIQILARAA